MIRPTPSTRANPWRGANHCDPDLALEAHFAVGLSAFYCSDLLSAREHLEQAISAYDPERHKGLASTYGGRDPGVCCLEYVAWTLWLLGYPDQALKRADEAQSLAKRVGVMLLEAGCTTAEVASITGQSFEMVEHYARQVSQRKLAVAAIAKWENAERTEFVQRDN